MLNFITAVSFSTKHDASITMHAVPTKIGWILPAFVDEFNNAILLLPHRDGVFEHLRDWQNYTFKFLDASRS